MYQTRFVEKHARGKRMKTVRDVSDKEYGLLRAIAEEEIPLKNERAQGLLQTIYDRDWWIACPCRKSETPLMSVRKQKNGTYALLRLKKRARHEESCPFFKERRERSIRRVRGNEVSSSRGVCFHRVHNEDEDSLGPPEDEEERIQRELSVMERALFTLMKKGKLTLYEGEDKNLRTQLRGMASVAGEIPLANVFWLRDYLYFKPWDIGRAASEVKEKMGQWPDWANPHGVFIFRVKEATGSTLYYEMKGEMKEIDLRKRVKITGRDTGGPFAVIMTIAGTDEDPEWLEPTKAFGIPMLSEELFFPVESYGERRVAKELCRLSRVWKETSGEKVSIEKLLFNIHKGGGACRPSFRVRWEGREMFVNVFSRRGRGDEEERAEEREIMRRFPGLVEVDADEVSDWDEEVESLEQRIKMGLVQAKKQKSVQRSEMQAGESVKGEKRRESSKSRSDQRRTRGRRRSGKETGIFVPD